MVDSLLDEKITVEEFREAYVPLFNGERADELTDEEDSYFGLIDTRIDFTERDPDLESIKVGFMNYEQFISWLKEFRKEWQREGWYEEYCKELQGKG